MEAYSHLTEWSSLQYCSTVYIDEASPPDLEKMWADPFHQVCGLSQLKNNSRFLTLVLKKTTILSFLGNVFAAHDSQHVEATAARRRRPNLTQLHRQSNEGGGPQKAAGKSLQPRAQLTLHSARGLRPRQILHQLRHAAVHAGLD